MKILVRIFSNEGIVTLGEMKSLFPQYEVTLFSCPNSTDLQGIFLIESTEENEAIIIDQESDVETILGRKRGYIEIYEPIKGE